MTTKQTVHTGVTHLEAGADHEGQRLDNFLAARLRDVPKSRIYRLLRTGEVRVNGGRCKPGYRLAAGDRVRLPPLRRSTPAATPGAAPALALPLPVLYQDADVLVIDKPSGAAVHGGSGIRAGVIKTLRSRVPDGTDDFLELAHRLDRETSGCLLLARNRPALLALHRQWRSAAAAAGDEAAAAPAAMEKRYLALVCGEWRGGERRVSAPLARDHRRSGERLSRVAPEQAAPGTRVQAALSVITPRRYFQGYTLVEIRLVTGRTHQARVHAASLGYPLAGDRKYGSRDRALHELGLRRLFLHASSLRFHHPLSGEVLLVEAPLPPQLAAVLEALQPAAL